MQHARVCVPFLSDTGCFWEMDDQSGNTRLIVVVAVEHHMVSRFHIRIVINGKAGTQSE